VSGFLEASAHRFSGFADLYDDVRPVPPPELGVLLASYCSRRPELVVDLGSGTGLSTRWASAWSDQVVGVEPSDDMRTAAAVAGGAGISYRPGWAHDTGLPTGAADVVLAVQAFHWMEPESTLAEVDRCLRPGGVFAAIDCDWPPVVGDAVCEQAWDTCRRMIRVFETRLASGASAERVRRWSKAEHLQRIEASGRFRWSREIAMASTDAGGAARFIGLLKSQGDYQALRRHGLSDADLNVDRFAQIVEDRLGSESRSWRFIYRARLGFKDDRVSEMHASRSDGRRPRPPA
jgi:SAM-dependent methyltransferase